MRSYHFFTSGNCLRNVIRDTTSLFVIYRRYFREWYNIYLANGIVVYFKDSMRGKRRLKNVTRVVLLKRPFKSKGPCTTLSDWQIVEYYCLTNHHEFWHDHPNDNSKNRLGQRLLYTEETNHERPSISSGEAILSISSVSNREVRGHINYKLNMNDEYLGNGTHLFFCQMLNFNRTISNKNIRAANR